MHMRIQSGMAFFLPGFKLATFLIQSGNYHATIFNDIYIYICKDRDVFLDLVCYIHIVWRMCFIYKILRLHGS